MYGSVQIEDPEETHPLGKNAFTPRYPVYHFDQTLAPGIAQSSNSTTEL